MSISRNIYNKRFNKSVSLQERILSSYEIADNGCWIWTRSISVSGGYGELNYNKQRYRAHVASYEIHNGWIPDGLVVRHTCDNPICINPNHLILGTQLDNIKDMHNRGRNKTKLNLDQVHKIKEKSNSGISGVIIAKEFNITPAMVSNIINNKSWRNK